MVIIIYLPLNFPNNNAWQRKIKMVVEMFESLSFPAYINAGDGELAPPLVALALALLSYSFYRIGLKSKAKLVQD